MTDVARLCLVELLYEQRPDITADWLRRQIGAHCPRAEIKSSDEGLQVLHHDAATRFKDGALPGITALMPSRVDDEHHPLELDLGQTWDWQGAAAAVSRGAHRLLLTELMTSKLDRKIRLDLLLRVLVAVVRATRPVALRWLSAGKLADPELFLQAASFPDEAQRFLVACNVRLFNMVERSGDMVMDTRGLSEFGIPDLQVHFRNLEPNALARHLYNCAVYLWDKGDVIKDGQTLDGLQPGQRWQCRHEFSLITPARPVLDLDPGPPFAAGKRN